MQGGLMLYTARKGTTNQAGPFITQAPMKGEARIQGLGVAAPRNISICTRAGKWRFTRHCYTRNTRTRANTNILGRENSVAREEQRGHEAYGQERHFWLSLWI